MTCRSDDRQVGASVAAGGTITCILLITNNGPMDQATDVTVSDLLPTGLSGATYVITSGGSCSGAWTGTLSLGDLNNGDSVRIVITATVDPSTEGPLVNEACVTSDVMDVHP